MLFRCCKSLQWSLLILICLSKQTCESGDFYKEQTERAWKASNSFSLDELNREDKPEGTFFLKNEGVRKNVKINGHVDADDTFILRSEFYQEEETEEPRTLKVCRKSGDSFNWIVERRLVSDVKWEDSEYADVRVCQGHHYKNHHRIKHDAKKDEERKKKELAASSHILDYRVWRVKKTVYADWRHTDNHHDCDVFQVEKKLVKTSHQEEGLKWVYTEEGAEEIVNSPHYTFASRRCLEEENGLCRHEQLAFICKPEPMDECQFLQALNCEYKEKRCLKKVGEHCVLWEKTFACKERGSQKDPFCPAMDTPEEKSEDEEVPLVEAVSKLSVLSEIHRDLQSSSADARYAGIFTGKARDCTKNVAGKLIYDCCFSMGGVATEVALTNCNAEEVALAELRDKGLCHYIGKKKNKVAGVVHSSDRHVYVCFVSKLARVVQEKAHEQLGIFWGDVDNPSCRGLTADEVSRLDFSSMDLSELYEDIAISDQKDVKSRLDSFSVRLEDIQKNMERGPL